MPLLGDGRGNSRRRQDTGGQEPQDRARVAVLRVKLIGARAATIQAVRQTCDDTKKKNIWVFDFVVRVLGNEKRNMGGVCVGWGYQV